MLGLVAGTATFAKSTTSTTSSNETRLVMTADQKLKFYVQPLHAKGNLSIIDAKGNSVYTSNVALQKGLYQQFDFSNLSTGTYHLTLITDGQTVTKTFVIQANPNSSYVMQEP